MTEAPCAEQSATLARALDRVRSRARLKTVFLMVTVLIAAVALRTAIGHLRALDGYKHVDFIGYYAWWLEYEHGENVWPATPAQGEIEPGVPRTPYRNYTPFFVETFAPITKLGANRSYWLWQSIQVLSFVLAVILFTRGSDPQLGYVPTVLVVAIAMFFRPFWGMLRYAQCAAMLLMLMTASWLSALRGRSMLAGAFLAGATLIKLYPGAMLGYFLLQRRWREMFWFAIFTSAGVLITGLQEWLDFLRYGVSQTLDYVTTYQIGIFANMYIAVAHILSVSYRQFVLSVAIALTAVVDLILLAAGSYATIRASERPQSQGVAFSLWAILCLLLSPVVWPHQLVLTAPACFFTLTYGASLAMRVRSWRAFAPVSFAISVIGVVLLELRDFSGIPGVHPRQLSLLVLYLLCIGVAISGSALERGWSRTSS